MPWPQRILWVKLVHKGNIQNLRKVRFAIGGYDLAAEEFRSETVTWRADLDLIIWRRILACRGKECGYD